jgi:beta-lactamase superfamily II metal-dependent hydrolase
MTTPQPEPRPAGRPRRLVVITIALVLLGLAAIPLIRLLTAPASPQQPWALAVCDIGQGDGLFLNLAPHTAIAVDTGPDPAKEDTCARRLGITDVPLAILTHFHADHVDGLPGLLQGRKVGEIETTTVADPPSGAALVRRLAAAAHVSVVPVQPDEQRSIGAVSWRVLWPQSEHPLHASAATSGGMGNGEGGMAEDGPTENSGPNNDSIVMAVTVDVRGAPFHILLTGDIETPVQQILLQDRRQYLKADVLKVPHHGSAKQDPDFLAAVAPSLSVISVGLGNPYGHPAARTVYLAGSDGARVYRTDLDGMVLISAPAASDAPIPVQADKGDGTLPTAPPSPTSTSHGRHGGGRSRHRAHHETYESLPISSASPNSTSGATSDTSSGNASVRYVSLPLRITPRRCARAATALSCVTTMSVRPLSRHESSSSEMISSRVSSSRLPEGSSASSTRGSLTSARAMAARCCWPPESSVGRWNARSARPTLPSAFIARSRRSPPEILSGTRAVSTFSMALSVGMRLKDWNTNPMYSARIRVSRASLIAPRFCPSNSTVPAVGRSRPPSNCSRVVLPCPVGPWIASHSPSAISASIGRIASTTAPPFRYCLLIPVSLYTSPRSHAYALTVTPHHPPSSLLPGNEPRQPPSCRIVDIGSDP